MGVADSEGIDRLFDDAERRELLLRAIRRVETEPSVLGASAHVLAVARCRRSP